MKRIIIKSILLLFFLSIMFVYNPALLKTNNSMNSSINNSTDNVTNSATLQVILHVNGTKTTNVEKSFTFSISVAGVYTVNNSFNPNPSYPMTYTVISNTGTVLVSSTATPEYQNYDTGTFNLSIFGVGTYNVTILKATDGISPSNPITLPLNTMSSETMPSWSYYQNIYYNINIPYYTNYIFYQNYAGNGNLTVTINSTDAHPLIFNSYTQHTFTKTLPAGNYSINIHKSSYSGRFNFSVTLSPFLSYAMLNNIAPINLNSPVNGNISITSQYNVSIMSSGAYTFNLSADQSSTYWIYIFNGSDYSLLGNASTYTYPEQVTLDITSGFYFIQIYKISGAGNFTLEVASSNQASSSNSTPSSSVTTSTTKTSTSPTSTSTTSSSSSSSTTTSSNPSTTTEKTKTSPFSSFDVIIMSFIIISLFSLMKRGKKLK